MNYSLIIDGKETGQDLEQQEVTNPATGEVVGTVPKGGKTEARQATDAAFEAFKTWSKLSAYERTEKLAEWARLMDEHTDELGELMTREQGKPLEEAKGEVKYANGFFKWYAEEGKRIYGETIPATTANKRIFVHKQPVGVVAVITPWNFPAAMITRKVGPAIASGCTVVIKPANLTPLTAIRMVQLAKEAGIPDGVVNVVTGDSKAIGEEWMQDMRVRKLTFTGSTEVGKELMKGAAETVKKISLELGGHAPSIVMDDANFDKAVEHVMAAKYRNAGQTCVCINRVYVHEKIADKFAQALAEKSKQLKVGNGLEEGVKVGPLINEDAIEKVEKHVQDAKDKGAKVLTGGEIKEGLFFEPTVLMNATDDMLCMNEETFGPLLPITTFKDVDEAIERANDTDFGLAAYVYTSSINTGIYIAENLEYGIVGLNDGIPSSPQAPFGGFKQSGIGREGGHYGMDEFLEIKYISLDLAE
ncbi:succinate-semialdehyde dehydrogenase/glutarate-semialdehyde dehydrogenase [Chryseomicrobium aureum]|uniref:NAD-dependent succinate-semialdehyde dehydrogenase n=1 Tax=Chryseomicrobium aureum TaxID=1441723 RepID=UPI001959A99F|nr:NAD-dependent succinate-semialdehyde dehydrogenase [Chryseomicrobium aureum]MBM7705890.1 succinate-semialdehyde dehydrogenase/glutarate-semialdehyde dehydrogenase [Chryseomicrobium aureum]